MKLSALHGGDRKKKKRVGRGPGSGLGKTAGRGHKGFGSRSGKRKYDGYEGGQFPLFRKVPHRGFTRGHFYNPYFVVNFDMINRIYHDGDVVSVETLKEKGRIPKVHTGGIKILSRGTLEKKVRIEAQAYSASAKKSLDEKKVEYKVIGKE
ncbi:MAG: 50S ribosomal protein L15 [Parachlamydiales bacterium]|nr:50S ribosomal protein L15 [Parachlamydiales bacterium]